MHKVIKLINTLAKQQSVLIEMHSPFVTLSSYLLALNKTKKRDNQQMALMLKHTFDQWCDDAEEELSANGEP